MLLTASSMKQLVKVCRPGGSFAKGLIVDKGD